MKQKFFSFLLIAVIIVGLMFVQPLNAHVMAQAPTATPTSSFVCPLGLQVNAVVSPTTALTQTITATASGGGLYKFTVFVRDTSNNLLGTFSATPSGSTASIPVTLGAGITNVLTVSVNGEVGCTQNGGPPVLTFVTTATTLHNHCN